MRVIVVPPPPPPPVQPVPSPAVPVLTSMGGLTQPYTYVTIPISPPEPIPRDPLMDYYFVYAYDAQAYYPKYTRYLSDTELTNHVWQFRDIADWINSNANDFVLVQRAFAGGHWIMVFIMQQDQLRFERWFKSQQVCMFKLRSVHGPEVTEWINANIRGLHRRNSAGENIWISIYDANEALAFKLRWDGIDEIAQTK